MNSSGAVVVKHREKSPGTRPGGKGLGHELTLPGGIEKLLGLGFLVGNGDCGQFDTGDSRICVALEGSCKRLLCELWQVWGDEPTGCCKSIA
jgi:hypothetical protein